jgi:DNA-binding NarL/FixJ family response regulator
MASVLVGRVRECDLLARAVRACADGRGATVLISGEGGIGKTSLAEHAVTGACELGFTVLTGQADALHAGLAYASVVTALRPHLARPRVARLLTGLDDLGLLLPHPALPPPPPVTDPDTARTRMFDAVRHLLIRLADESPTLLLIEDLHHADPGTLALLRHITDATTHRLLLVGTYRTAVGPLGRFVASTPHQHVPLGPLRDDEVAALAGPLSPTALRELVTRTRGNPLFVTQLSAAGRSGPLPAPVRDTVLDQLRTLPEPRRTALELDAAAREPRAAREPLDAEVAYAELTGGERAARHAAVARALELADPADVRALAPHYLRGGDHLPPARVVEVLTTAGRRTLAGGAADDAVRYLAAAVDMARTHSPHQVTDLLDELGLAHQQTGSLDEATARWSEALARAERTGDRGRQSRLRARIAMVTSERGEYASDTHAEVSVEHAVRAGDYAALLRWALAVRHRGVHHIRQLCDQLVAACGEDPSPAARSLCEQGRGYLALLDGDIPTARHRLTVALDQARHCADTAPELGYGALRQLVGVLVLTGDIAGALRCVDEHRPNLALPAARYSVGFVRAMVRYFAGGADAAQPDLQRVITEARQHGLHRLLPRMVAFHAFLLAELGRSTEARRELATIQSTTDDPEYGLTDLVAIARCAITPTDAPPPGTPSFADAMVDCLRLMTAGRAAVIAGDLPAARRVAHLLRAASGMSELLTGLADQQEGLVARLSGHGDDADRLLAAAARRLRRIGAPHLAVVTAPRPVAGAGPLTARQHQIVELVGAGLSNSDIADRLTVSERTVETHLRNIYRRLNIGSRTALAVWAVR